MSKSDRELLELAARAAVELGSSRFSQIEFVVQSADGGFDPWNPLKHDGDALRLAVATRLRVSIGAYGCAVQWEYLSLSGWIEERRPREEGAGKHPIAVIQEATRRAITRAAAVIGEQMP
jgi:hypothetical protein